MTVAEAFSNQAKSCIAMGSPFLGQLLRLVAERLEPDNAVAETILNWSGDPHTRADSLPLRLAGSLHALKLENLAFSEVFPPNTPDDDTLWRAINVSFTAHEAHFLHWLKSPPQTNEVRRSAILLAALAEVAKRYPDQPIALFELGASGGLNLLADHYQLRLPGLTLGSDAAKVVLKPDWSGPLPPAKLPQVVVRQGVDLAPLDASNPNDRLRFLAYLWPDQPERLHLTELALSEVQKSSLGLDTGDAGAWLEGALARPQSALRVVFHTVAWQYFPRDTKARVLRSLSQSETPLLQISMEADDETPGALVTLTHWPEARVETLGRADFHGRWVVWH